MRTEKEKYEWAEQRALQVVEEAFMLMKGSELTASELVGGAAMHLLSDIENNPEDFIRYD